MERVALQVAFYLPEQQPNSSTKAPRRFPPPSKLLDASRASLKTSPAQGNYRIPRQAKCLNRAVAPEALVSATWPHTVDRP